MKLILAVLSDEDTENVSHNLIVAGFRVTRIASTGGFWRRGNTTLMIGLDDDKVDDAIQILRESCAPPKEPGSHRVTMFVLNVAHFEQI
jgi:uncharacterized protein YaaQ